MPDLSFTDLRQVNTVVVTLSRMRENKPRVLLIVTRTHRWTRHVADYMECAEPILVVSEFWAGDLARACTSLLIYSTSE